MSNAGSNLMALLGGAGPAPDPPEDPRRVWCLLCGDPFLAGPATAARIEAGEPVVCRPCAMLGDAAAAQIEAALVKAEAHAARGRERGADRDPLGCADAWVDCRDALRVAWAERERMTVDQRRRADHLAFYVPTHMAPEFAC